MFPQSLSPPLLNRAASTGTEYETVSILKLIERRFNLAPLSTRDKDPKINDLTHALSCGGIDTTACSPGSHTLTVNKGNATGQPQTR